MEQRLDNQYRDYKKLRVVEAAELLRSFIWESDEEDTGYLEEQRTSLSGSRLQPGKRGYGICG